jgi:ketosteroid isomerase-like protein
MKFNTLLVALIISLLSIAGFGQKTAAGTAKPDPSKGVKDAFQRLTDGIRQVDVEKVMSVYDNNPDILFFNNNGSVTRGWQTMKENRQSSYAKVKNVSLDITGLQVQMLGPNAAFVTSKWKQDQEYEGKLESASGRMSLVFKKVGNDWKVVHIHTSPDNPGPTRPVFESERIKTM